jgi:hypothetical protein
VATITPRAAARPRLGQTFFTNRGRPTYTTKYGRIYAICCQAYYMYAYYSLHSLLGVLTFFQGSRINVQREKIHYAWSTQYGCTN